MLFNIEKRMFKSGYLNKFLFINILYLSCLMLLSKDSIAETFVMGFGVSPQEDDQHLFYKNIYSKLFESIGYEFEYIVCPSKRCSKLANSGKIDGEPQRVINYQKRQSNLIRVEEPIFINRNIALAKNTSIVIDGLESLSDRDIVIGYLRGSVWSREKLYKYPRIRDKIQEVATISQALKMLKADRIDVFIGLEVAAYKALSDPLFERSGIRMVGVVGENFSYPYFHKSHIEIVPLIAKELRRLKLSGEYESILKNTIPHLK